MNIKTNFDIAGQATEVTCDEISIMGDDGRALFHIRCDKGTLEVSNSMIAKLGDTMYDTTLMIIPRASNRINVNYPSLKARAS